MRLLNFMLLNYLALFLGLAVIYIVHISARGKSVGLEAQHKLLIDRSPRLYNSTLETQSKPRWVNQVRVSKPKYVPQGETRIDWRRRRRLWFDERKVAEPNVDWRIRRRLWYVE